jgi:hypothetical protein
MVAAEGQAHAQDATRAQPDRVGVALMTDPSALRDAHEAIQRAIAELRAAGIAVPISLHRACHALSYAIDDGRVVLFKQKPEQ